MSRCEQSEWVRDVLDLPHNGNFANMLDPFNLKCMNITWEDCSRYKNSCWGDNISDMTLVVDEKRIPVIRHPNFSDLSTDTPIEKFTCAVGNESGQELKSIPFSEYLDNIKNYTGNTERIKRLRCGRDNVLLTSSQACILPAENGVVEFAVKLYNYQSRYSSPSVLVIISSAEGTSCQIVDSDTTLYINLNGERGVFTAKRLEDDRKERNVPLEGKITKEEKQRNVIFIYQIPLVKRVQMRKLYPGKHGGAKYIQIPDGMNYFGGTETVYCSGAPASVGNNQYALNVASGQFGSNVSTNSFGSDNIDISEDNLAEMEATLLLKKKKKKRSVSRGLDYGIISTKNISGKFYGLGTDTFKLVRDERYPIRCTVQHYRITDTNEFTPEIVQEIANDLNKVYSVSASSILPSSLVVGGYTYRQTESVSVPTSQLKPYHIKPVDIYNF